MPFVSVGQRDYLEIDAYLSRQRLFLRRQLQRTGSHSSSVDPTGLWNNTDNGVHTQTNDCNHFAANNYHYITQYVTSFTFSLGRVMPKVALLFGMTGYN